MEVATTVALLFESLSPAVDVMKAGSYVTLRNAKVDMFRGSMRLVVDQWGVVEPASGASFTPKVRESKRNSHVVKLGLVESGLTWQLRWRSLSIPGSATIHQMQTNYSLSARMITHALSHKNAAELATSAVVSLNALCLTASAVAAADGLQPVAGGV